jgi:hypothetical protein
VAKPKVNWHFRDLKFHFRKPKSRPALSGDARVAAWRAMSVETKRAMGKFRSMTDIKPDSAPHAWKAVRSSTVGPRAAFGGRTRKGN